MLEARHLAKNGQRHVVVDVVQQPCRTKRCRGRTDGRGMVGEERLDDAGRVLGDPRATEHPRTGIDAAVDATQQYASPGMPHGDPSSPLADNIYEDDITIPVDIADADLDDLGRSQPAPPANPRSA